MTDLIERLRSQAHLTQRDGLLALLETGKEAADIIERDADNTRALLSRISQLEADNAAMNTHLATAQRQYADLYRKHEAMRAELEAVQIYPEAALERWVR